MCMLAFGGSKNTLNEKSIAPLAFNALVIWGLFLVIWTPRTYDLGFSIGYTGWFLINVALIYFATQYYGYNRNHMDSMLRWYLNIYVAISAFGLIQLIVGIFGYNILVTQWWIAGKLPRLNGFSYEPSYYATYLITGWGMFAWLVERDVSLYSRRYTQLSFAVITSALILSSSRMAILVVAGYAIYYLVKNLIWIALNLKINVKFLKVVSFCVAGVVLFSLFITLTVGFSSLKFLLFGTGLGGTANHSATIRFGQLQDTINLIKESPFIGYGLGGIWSVIAAKRGLPVKEVTGMNVTAEVLASTGLIGFPFYIIFISTLIFGSFKFLKKRHIYTELLAASGVGFVLLYLILQFNQSILRVYLWNHIAVMCILYHYVANLQPTSAIKRAVRVARPLEGGQSFSPQ